MAMPDLRGVNMLDLHQPELSCCNPAVAQRALSCFLQVLPSLQASHGRMDTETWRHGGMDTWRHGRMDTCAAYTGVSITEVTHFTASVLLHVDKYEAAVEQFIAVLLQQAGSTHI